MKLFLLALPLTLAACVTPECVVMVNGKPVYNQCYQHSNVGRDEKRYDAPQVDDDKNSNDSKGDKPKDDSNGDKSKDDSNGDKSKDRSNDSNGDKSKDRSNDSNGDNSDEGND